MKFQQLYICQDFHLLGEVLASFLVIECKEQLFHKEATTLKRVPHLRFPELEVIPPDPRRLDILALFQKVVTFKSHMVGEKGSSPLLFIINTQEVNFSHSRYFQIGPQLQGSGLRYKIGEYSSAHCVWTLMSQSPGCVQKPVTSESSRAPLWNRNMKNSKKFWLNSISSSKIDTN